DDHRLLIADDELCLRRALVDGDGAERALRGAGVRDLLRELEADLVGVVDVRLDLDLRPDVLARRGETAAEQPEAEPAPEGARGAARLPGERAEAPADVLLQRDVLSDGDGRVLVVEREDVRRGEHVVV